MEQWTKMQQKTTGNLEFKMLVQTIANLYIHKNEKHINHIATDIQLYICLKYLNRPHLNVKHNSV